MNILVVNWTWYPSGGDWTYVENTTKLYEEKGHKVIPFSMKDDRNFASEYSSYFISNIDYKKLNKRSLASGVKAMTKSICSLEAKRNLEKLLSEVVIDFAHINVIHHYITPVILKVLNSRRIPIIWTLHEYTPLCPESTFVQHGKLCERCIGGAFYNCITHACKKGSYLASTVAALENYVHKYLNYYAYVDYYICPSKFMYEKFKLFGFFNEKLIHLYHGYNYEELEEVKLEEQFTADKYIVFVGRLEKIKGVHTLLNAMKRCPEISLLIVGSGTQEAELRALKNIESLSNVTFVGKKNRKETLNIINQAAFLVCTSEWYEVLGFTVVEAMALSKPVIGANIGAIPEMVINEYTGLLFEPGNAEDLSQKMSNLFERPDLILQMGNKARSHIIELINNQKHYEGLRNLIHNL